MKQSTSFCFSVKIEELYSVALKGIDKKVLIGPAHGFNSQLLNLFGFSISISFVWCIISDVTKSHPKGDDDIKFSVD